MKLGTSPSSGLVIQSPDGQPAGIFFQPRRAVHPVHNNNNTEAGSSGLMQPASLIRDQGNLKPPMQRSSLSRRQAAANLNSDGAASGTIDKGKRPSSLSRKRSSLHHITEDMSESNEASADERPSTARPSRPVQRDMTAAIESLAGLSHQQQQQQNPPVPIFIDMEELNRPDSATDGRRSASPTPVSPGGVR